MTFLYSGAPPMPYSHATSLTAGSLHHSRFPPPPPPPPNIPLPPRPPSSTVTSTPLVHRREGSANPKPSSIPFPVKSPDPSKPSATSRPLTPTSPSAPSFSSDKSSQKKASVSGDTIRVVTHDDVTSSFIGHSSDDEGSEFGGLAYAQSDESDDGALLAYGMGRTSGQLYRSPTASSAYSDNQMRTEQTPTEHDLDVALAALLRSPTSTDTPLSPSSHTSSLHRAPKPPMRSLTAVSQREPSDNQMRTEQTHMEHNLDVALAALLRSPTSTDTPLSPSSHTSSLHHASNHPMRSLTAVSQRESSALGGSTPRRGGTISGAIGGGSSDNSRKDRLSQDSTASGLDRHREKVMKCIRCSTDIEDKRWIRMENGKGVLCDKCWKNMYLPKV